MRDLKEIITANKTKLKEAFLKFDQDNTGKNIGTSYKTVQIQINTNQCGLSKFTFALHRVLVLDAQTQSSISFKLDQNNTGKARGTSKERVQIQISSNQCALSQLTLALYTACLI